MKSFHLVKLNPSLAWVVRMLTKRNIKTKSGLQTAKSLTNSEFANEMTPQNKKAKKEKPHT
jgi:hypothetical protein